VPALPSELENFKLSNTALVGYPDTVDYHQVNFEVWSKAVNPTYIADRNEEFYDKVCPRPADELLRNNSFNCNATAWVADGDVDAEDGKMIVKDGSEIRQEI
jgi:hypothetical protein